MNKAILKLGQELNRDIVVEVKQIDEQLHEVQSEAAKAYLLKTKRELNRERINVLGLYIIDGGKSE